MDYLMKSILNDVGDLNTLRGHPQIQKEENKSHINLHKASTESSDQNIPKRKTYILG